MTPTYERLQDKILRHTQRQLLQLAEIAPRLAAADTLAAALCGDGLPTEVVITLGLADEIALYTSTANQASIGHALIEWGYAYTSETHRHEGILCQIFKITTTTSGEVTLVATLIDAVDMTEAA